MTLIAQISDTHVVDPNGDDICVVDNNARLVTTVASLNAERERPVAVIGTGDLTNNGTPTEYEQLSQILDRLDAPFLPLGGNHDNVERLKRCFPDTPWTDADHASWSVVCGEVAVVGLDTNEAGQDGGYVDADRLSWLDAALSAASHPTVLAMHHPPFTTGIDPMDGMGFNGLAELTEVVESHQVDEVWCGHLHRPAMGWLGRVPATVSPTTVHLVRLGLEDAPLALQKGPAGYLLHRHLGSWVTHTRYIYPETEIFELS